jgi:hypothetical protein
VNQRGKEIRNLTDKESWNHCPGAMNPADLPSRGIRVDEMVSNPLRWNGPAFLQRPEEEWHKLGNQKEIDKAAEDEVVKQPKTVTRVLVGAVNFQIPDVASVIDCDRFSDKLKLLRVTAYGNRFISLLKSRVKGTNEQVIAHGLNLSAAEILRAENMWIRSVKESSFAEELKYLRSKSKASSPPNVRNLGLYVDQDDRLKCNGRLNNAPFLESEKRPVFPLPKNNFLLHNPKFPFCLQNFLPKISKYPSIFPLNFLSKLTDLPGN